MVSGIPPTWCACADGPSRVEAVPEDIRVRQTFEKQYGQLVKDSINSMYAWAEKPLKGRTLDARDELF